ncbi:tripartite motif-containing protein 35 isoform X2 [Oreochromis niloticus]|uniref:Tripartite motif-containing protein 35 n=1 Tax=Oreochromis niloticus TaxID=8128 RepID=I3IVB9_ORENI|nr:tripartite motif-containing protein 35 isoform X2 [Oreochromis niloticus]
MSRAPRNLALRNLSDNLRRERSQAASASKELCSLHDEKLRLFCQDDQQLICVVCRDAKQHKNHNCVPINEAAEEHRLQAQDTEKIIKGEFQKLYQFLRAEEAGRIDAVREEAVFQSEIMNMEILIMNAEISSLKDKIKTLEEEMKAGDMAFMMNIKSTMERSQCTLSDPVTPSGALIDEAKHLGKLLFSVWIKMKTLIQYTPVVMDPNTCSQRMTVSEHLTCLTSCDSTLFPQNPERLYDSDILGYEGFSSGKHSWDVEVDGYWAVGVAARTRVSDSKKIWGIYVCMCADILFECTPEGDAKVMEDSFLQKVRVNLDYDKGILSFFDLGRKVPVHTVKYTCTEKLFPYFRGETKVLPPELSVGITQVK